MPKITLLKDLKKPKSDRKKEAQTIYNTQRWRNLRNSHLMKSPLCEVCGKELATQVHHIDAFMKYTGDKRLEKAYDYNNLMSICDACHHKLHNNEK